MDSLTSSAFNAIIYDTQNIVYRTQAPGYFPKVVENNDAIIRVFLRKDKFFSSDRIKPRALKFYENARKLLAYGFNAPVISQFASCQAMQAHLIKYKKIPGEDLRTILAVEPNVKIIKSIIHFIAMLHEKGVFFRSIHLGNLIWHHNEIHLIDITDVQFKSRPLHIYERYRNLKHIFDNKEDQAFWQHFTLTRFLEIYTESMQSSQFLRKIFFHRLLKKNKGTTP
ncbi:MAG: hypothetical protein H0W64_04630 [Gammaproteobacteria bacterium]|nr:hypothetical protein [Gammaproteobacteria bacterium]